MKIGVTVLFPLLVLSIPCKSNSQSEDSLKLVHVLFRHGDRTPLNVTYPRDPYRKERYFPYGYSQLVNTGKQRAYTLGKSLRRRYDEFLSKTYFMTETSAYTTDTGRSRASLSLVLAGLYPPRGTPLEWDVQLNWNPINYNVLPTTQSLLVMPSEQCENLLKALTSFMNTNEGKKMTAKYDDIKMIMANNTGLNYDNPFMYLLIYDYIIVQEEQGLEPPKWFIPLLPTLEQSFQDVMAIFGATKEIQRYSIGGLIEKIAADSMLKLKNASKYKNTKLFMYSSHDTNVALLLNAINPSALVERPPYSAAVIVEIHTINDINGVKVFYQPYVTDKPRAVSIAQCGEFCPLYQFIGLYKDIFPESSEC